MSLTERLSKLNGQPTPIAPKKPERAKLTPRLAQNQGAPAAVAVEPRPREKLTERLVGMNGTPAPLGVPEQPRKRLTERLAGLSGQTTPVGAPPKPRVSLTERLGGLTGRGTPVAAEKAPRESLTARLGAVVERPAVSVPAVAKPAPGLHARMVENYQILQQTTPALITIPFAEWLPDLPDYLNRGATVAKNVIPVENDYGPLGALDPATAALNAKALGATAARDTSGNNYNYAGDVSKLYEVRASGVTDKSKGGGYSTGTGEVWEFVLYGSTLIASNYSDDVQGIVVGSAGLFADQFTSTLTPKARHLATIREFLFLGNTNDTTDGAVPNRTWWSASRDAADMDPDAQTQSDFEDRPAGGHVQKIVGGVEYGLLFQEEAITRITYAGGKAIFQFDSIDRKRGTPIPNSVIGHGRMVYFLSEEGFFVTDGAQSYPIGANAVDKTFWNQFDVADIALVSATIDPINKIVAWAFPGAGGVLKIYFYNWETRRWSEAEVDVEILFNPVSEGFTLEELDAVALDSAADTTLSANEAGGQTIISVTSVSGFSVNDTARITLNDATIHQSKINAVGASTITIDDALPSAADSGKRFVRTTIDVLTPGLDSAQWQGGGINFGAFDTAHKLAYFDGSNLAATIETGETELHPGRISKVTKARPLVDGGTITVALAGRARIQDTVSFGGSGSLDDIGEVGLLDESRYHRFRVKVAAGGSWTHAQGIQIQATPMGTR